MTRRIDGQNRDWTLGWTPENMLQTATNNQNDALRFIYDADGMLLLRVEDEGQPTEQKTVYLGKIFEHNLTLNSYRKHYLFAGRLIAIREGLTAGSGVSYLASDALGSVTTTLFANGTIKAQKRYKPFGEERYSQNSTPTGQRFTGQRWDEGLGLYDYNARYYDPVNGRFISADTYVPGQNHTGLVVDFHEIIFLLKSKDEASGSGASLPQSLNRFAYVLNNPINYSDVTGHDPLDPNRGSITLDGQDVEDAIEALKTIAELVTANGDDMDFWGMLLTIVGDAVIAAKGEAAITAIVTLLAEAGITVSVGAATIVALVLVSIVLGSVAYHGGAMANAGSWILDFFLPRLEEAFAAVGTTGEVHISAMSTFLASDMIGIYGYVGEGDNRSMVYKWQSQDTGMRNDVASVLINWWMIPQADITGSPVTLSYWYKDSEIYYGNGHYTPIREVIKPRGQ